MGAGGKGVRSWGAARRGLTCARQYGKGAPRAPPPPPLQRRVLKGLRSLTPRPSVGAGVRSSGLPELVVSVFSFLLEEEIGTWRSKARTTKRRASESTGRSGSARSA